MGEETEREEDHGGGVEAEGNRAGVWEEYI